MSRMEYCGTICVAAKMVGIPAKDKGTSVVFFDPLTQVEISGKPMANPKNRLTSACIALNRYFCK